MDNKQVENLLFGYFAGELNESEEKKLLEWLEADPANKEKLSQMADWWTTAHVPLYASDLKTDFEKHFSHIITEQAHINMPFFNWRTWRNIAASVIILIAVGSLSYYAGRLDTLVEEHTNDITLSSAFSEITTPLGSTSKVILPDGTQVWINAGSTLKYDQDFDKSVRQVSLIGEAYFEVVPDSLRPFIVRSDNLDIEVLGTSFNVMAYENEPEIDVSLITGSINVNINNSESSSPESMILSPDTKLIYNKETKATDVTGINGNDAMAWINGRVKFVDLSFEKIARNLERKFNVSISVQNNQLKKDIFSGSFSSYYTLDQILDEIDMENKYRREKINGQIIIRDK